MNGIKEERKRGHHIPYRCLCLTSHFTQRLNERRKDVDEMKTKRELLMKNNNKSHILNAIKVDNSHTIFPKPLFSRISHSKQPNENEKQKDMLFFHVCCNQRETRKKKKATSEYG
jgi:hypothetical protein